MIKSFYKYDTAISILTRQQALFCTFNNLSVTFLIIHRDNKQESMTLKLQMIYVT